MNYIGHFQTVGYPMPADEEIVLSIAAKVEEEKEVRTTEVPAEVTTIVLTTESATKVEENISGIEVKLSEIVEVTTTRDQEEVKTTESTEELSITQKNIQVSESTEALEVTTINLTSAATLEDVFTVLPESSSSAPTATATSKDEENTEIVTSVSIAKATELPTTIKQKSEESKESVESKESNES